MTSSAAGPNARQTFAKGYALIAGFRGQAGDFGTVIFIGYKRRDLPFGKTGEFAKNISEPRLNQDRGCVREDIGI